MCDCENIEVVGIKRGDTLVFFVDTDYYDLEDISDVMESVKSAFPTAKVLMLPDDMIADVKIFREEAPLIELNQIQPVDWDEMAEKFTNGYDLTEIHP